MPRAVHLPMPAHPGLCQRPGTRFLQAAHQQFRDFSSCPSRNGPGACVCYASSSRCQEPGSKHRRWCHLLAGLSHMLPSHYKASTVSGRTSEGKLSSAKAVILLEHHLRCTHREAEPPWLIFNIPTFTSVLAGIKRFSRICPSPQVALKPTALFSLSSPSWVADGHRQPVLPMGSGALHDILKPPVPVPRPRT